MNPAVALGTTGVAATLTTLAAWQLARAGMQPTSQLFGRSFVDTPDPDPLHHTVALTYDDGPSPRNTPALLDLLATYQVRATFFLVGAHVRRYPELARRIAEAGHLIGNHTDTHPNLARLSPAGTRKELRLCQQTLHDTVGKSPYLFRPPYGARRPDTLRSAADLGLSTVLWNVTVQDWEDIRLDRMLAITNGALARNRSEHRTSTVLLHDASHLDTPAHQLSRDAAIHVTRALLQRPDLRFAVPVV